MEPTYIIVDECTNLSEEDFNKLGATLDKIKQPPMKTTNEMNVIIQERARIREAIVRLKVIPSHEVNGLGEHINRGEVLAILTENILEVPQEEKK